MLNHRSIASALVTGLMMTSGARHALAQEAMNDTADFPSADQSPTAQELLKALRKDRATREVIPPDRGMSAGSLNAKGELWPEGWALVDITGFLRRDGMWWIFVPDSLEHAPPIRLLPNAALEVLVRTATHAAEPIRFIVSGQATVYHGRNYLLLSSVVRDTARPSGPESTPAVSDAEPVAADAPVDDVLSVLQEQQAGGDLLDTRHGLETAHPSAHQSLLPDGSAVINRPARVVRQGQRYDLVFESDHPENPEPPMTLLPNLVMQRMIDTIERGNHGQIFRVSGGVTQFQGRNYILVRSAPSRINVANFHK